MINETKLTDKFDFPVYIAENEDGQFPSMSEYKAEDLAKLPSVKVEFSSSINRYTNNTNYLAVARFDNSFEVTFKENLQNKNKYIPELNATMYDLIATMCNARAVYNKFTLEVKYRLVIGKNKEYYYMYCELYFGKTASGRSLVISSMLDTLRIDQASARKDWFSKEDKPLKIYYREDVSDSSNELSNISLELNY